MHMRNIAIVLVLFHCIFLATRAECHFALKLQDPHSSELDILKLVTRDIQSQKDFHPDCITLSLEHRHWDVAQILIKGYFLVKNIDLFPAFISAKKKIFRRDRPHFENLTGLPPLISPSVKK